MPNEHAGEVTDPAAAERFVFASYLRALPRLAGDDERTRRPDFTARLLQELGEPQLGLPALLVAGSKGKGSTCAFAAGLLRATGARVGLFSSPHLLDVRERIRVDGRSIPPADFTRLTARLAALAAPLAASLPADRYLSPLGLLLCVALLHFREREVEVAVVEAGRGARFDDTRLVECPVSVITRVMREHPRELGPGLGRIAWHKAGAIGPGGVTISAPQRPTVLAALRAEVAAQGARLALLGRDLDLRRGRGTVEVLTARRTYTGLRPALRGPHQAENLALALAAVEQLWPALGELPEADIRTAVAGVRWPGRCEPLQERPLVLVDGAINAAAARAFLAAARPISRPPIVAIAGAPADKDYPGLFRTLAPRVDRLIVTRARNPYLHFPDDALAVARRFSPRAEQAPDLDSAVALARSALGGDGTLWIVGTQSLVADALRHWGRDLEQL